MHATLIFARSSVAGTILVWAELAVVAAVAMVQFKRRRIWALFAVAIVAIAFASRSATGEVVVAASGIPHAAAYISLLIVFGSSLLRGRTPLISLLSQKLRRGPLSPEIARYTRAVTVAWCCFFSLQLVGSLVLLVYTPAAIWSLFVNVLNVPLIVAMFLGEYAYRRLRFRNQRHRTIFQVIQAFTDGEAWDSRSVGGSVHRSEPGMP
jgi:uncharacterized membrane protein